MKSNARGFTLLEVIVAISILAFLSLFTVQAIQRAVQTKAKVQGQIDKTSTMRDALRVMVRDINMAFNYHDPYIELYNLAQKQRQKASQQPVAPTPGQPVAPPLSAVQQAEQNNPNKYKLKQEKVYTQFIGEPKQLTLTTTSNVRMMEDQAISSQAEIQYTLKPCRRRSTQTQSSQCLWRRVADYIHDDITQDYGQWTVLLENVTDFKLRYLGPGREEEWVDTWITTDRGDDQTKNKFPYAVEITIEVKDADNKKDKPLRMTTVAAIRNPNNPATTTDDPNAAAAQQQQGTNQPITDPGTQKVNADGSSTQ